MHKRAARLQARYLPLDTSLTLQRWPCQPCTHGSLNNSHLAQQEQALPLVLLELLRRAAADQHAAAEHAAQLAAAAASKGAAADAGAGHPLALAASLCSQVRNSVVCMRSCGSRGRCSPVILDVMFGTLAYSSHQHSPSHFRHLATQTLWPVPTTSAG